MGEMIILPNAGPTENTATYFPDMFVVWEAHIIPEGRTMPIPKPTKNVDNQTIQAVDSPQIVNKVKKKIEATNDPIMMNFGFSNLEINIRMNRESPYPTQATVFNSVASLS